MKKQVINWIFKAVPAGLLALVLLCLFCALWYNVPVHYDNPDGATEYKWEPSRFYSRGTEGFALGRTNNDGFNNLRDYTPGDQVDILLMGSSHMEGFCVGQDENAAAVLNTLFGGEKYAYNIGTAGHTFLYCAKHLDRALAVYAPAGYAVIELATLSYDPAAMDAAADGTLADIPSHTGGVITALQKLPFLRLFYTKYFQNGNEAVKAAAGTDAPVGMAEFEASLSRLLEKVGTVSAAHGVKTILVYMPTVTPDEQGRGRTDTRPEELEAFKRLAAENGLLFLNLTESYVHAAEEDGRLPFGFSNTAPGQGHVNRLGHRLFAEAVYALIEGEG